ncbi:MAG: hypothetical protein ACI4RK_09625 [Oscillospiraceae bacterium]
MKKYVNAFRMFFGRCNLSSMAAFLGTMAVMVLIVAALEFMTAGGDFTAGMTAGMSIMLAGVIPLTGSIFLNALYAYANPATPGHKYYLSIPDSAEQFRRAVIAANVFSLALGLVLSAIMDGVFTLLHTDISITYFGLVMLFALLGLCNFSGYIRNTVVRLLVVCGLFSCTGFAAGFFSADNDEEGITFSYLYEKAPWLLFVLAGTAVLLFAAGLAYSVAVSRRKWVRE